MHAVSRLRWLRTVGSALFLVFVCTVALLAVGIPMVLGAQSYTVLTGSMRPTLPPGALVAVRATDPSDIRIGDVITFQVRSGEPEVATHRVAAIGIDGRGERVFTTKGDANNVADAAPVRPVQIRGVLVYAVPVLGYLNIWATPSTKSLLVAFIGVAAIAWGCIVLVRDATRRRHGRQGPPPEDAPNPRE